MERIILMLMCLVVFSCGKHDTKTDKMEVNVRPILEQCDNTAYYKQVEKQKSDSIVLLREKVIYLLDSLQKAKDVSDYKLSRISYYMDICASRETNKKYLYGWIRRVLEK